MNGNGELANHREAECCGYCKRYERCGCEQFGDCDAAKRAGLPEMDAMTDADMICDLFVRKDIDA